MSQASVGTPVHFNSQVSGHLSARIINLNPDGTVSLAVDAQDGEKRLIEHVHRNDEAEDFETWHFAEGCAK